MIDVVLVDDHPAVLAGLVGLVDTEPGVACRATAGSAAAAREAVLATSPAVVVVDYDLPDSDGLALCADLKSLSPPPGVIVYTAFARPRLLPAAAVAGADAMLDKAATADELFRTIRAVSRGATKLPTAPHDVMERCLAQLHPADVPLFGMAVNGAAVEEIAEVVGTDLEETRRRLAVLLGRLQQRPTGPITPHRGYYHGSRATSSM